MYKTPLAASVVFISIFEMFSALGCKLFLHARQFVIMVQQAALHALANIAGESRSETTRILNSTAEESLRRLIYEVASRSTKLTPSVSFLFCFFSSDGRLLLGIVIIWTMGILIVGKLSYDLIFVCFVFIAVCMDYLLPGTILYESSSVYVFSFLYHVKLNRF